MADDFAKTADRMMLDAQSLRTAGSHRNACYLSGYVVECTLKVLLEKSNLEPAKTHDLESLHIEVSKLLLHSSSIVARYGNPASLAPTLLQQIAPPKPSRHKGQGFQHFCHWDPYHRYDGTRWDTDAISGIYLGEAKKASGILAQMRIDGVL